MFDESLNEFTENLDWLFSNCSSLQLSQTVNSNNTFIKNETIDKIPYIEYKGLTKEQNLRVWELSKMLLTYSKYKNKGNEVAITYRLDKESFASENDCIAVALGDETHIEILDDPKTKMLFDSSSPLLIVLLHNHPNNSLFSFKDLKFYFNHDQIKLFICITNKGKIRSISRSDLLLKDVAFSDYKEILRKKINNFDYKLSTKTFTIQDKIIAYQSLELWFKQLSRYGMNYQEGGLNSEKQRKNKRTKRNKMDNRGR